MSPHKLSVVAAALIDTQNRILLSERPAGKFLEGMWEFPGGKISSDERPEEALIRELKEELGIKVSPHSLMPLNFVSHSYTDFDIILLLFVCHQWEGEIVPREMQNIRWVAVEQLHSYPMPPADVPLIPSLVNYLT
jgi:8-oxo-dGTP diphosphatase